MRRRGGGERTSTPMQLLAASVPPAMIALALGGLLLPITGLCCLWQAVRRLQTIALVSAEPSY